MSCHISIAEVYLSSAHTCYSQSRQQLQVHSHLYSGYFNLQTIFMGAANILGSKVVSRYMTNWCLGLCYCWFVGTKVSSWEFPFLSTGVFVCPGCHYFLKKTEKKKKKDQQSQFWDRASLVVLHLAKKSRLVVVRYTQGLAGNFLVSAMSTLEVHPLLIDNTVSVHAFQQLRNTDASIG